ncbi:MAG: hypothetical protein ABI547_07280 [Betaproteobacteria bacterium]
MRVAVFALLLGNTLYYLYAGTLSKGLDATAWLVLLALYTLETAFAAHVRTPRAAIAMRAVRLVAAVGVCAAGISYVLERDALDAFNTALWIGVVVLLEFEVRRPRKISRFRAAYTATAAALYTGLAILVLVWAWRAEWFDAYDALLWLIAFAMIEMDVLAVAGPAASG